MCPKVLVVDDSRTVRLAVTKMFRKYECDIFEAANGVEAVAIASRENPDVIILDFKMPIMDGPETLAKIKATGSLKKIPVIMLTAEASRENVARIAQLGVRGYLIKPLDEQRMMDCVGRIVELKLKGEAVTDIKRFDHPVSILVLDDKPVIQEQIRAGLSGTPWTVRGCAQVAEAEEQCTQALPDVILVNLSLPDDAAFAFFEKIRASNQPKKVTAFGLCIRTAIHEQDRALQAGMSGVITKPIDFEELKGKIVHALNLDNSEKYFEQSNGVLILKLPLQLNGSAPEILRLLDNKIAGVVDAGADKMVIDLGQLMTFDSQIMNLVLTAAQHCDDLALKLCVVAPEAIATECKRHKELKHCRFVAALEDAINNKPAAQAVPLAA